MGTLARVTQSTRGRGRISESGSECTEIKVDKKVEGVERVEGASNTVKRIPKEILKPSL